MKILWITNSLFKEYYDIKGLKAPVTGGWMHSLAIMLKQMFPDIEFAVASRRPEVKILESVKTDNFTFYAIPGSVYQNKYDSGIENYWKEIKELFNPDIVHIHGSEFPHGLAYVKANGPERVVVSLQGLISRIARYNQSGLRKVDIYNNLTFYDAFLSSTPIGEKRRYARQGLLEEELLKSVHHIIGRTTWDNAHTWSINPLANYHFCNETLREEFFSSDKWNINKCQRHRIFLSQAFRPIKGLHKVIEALPLIIRSYPDTQVYVAGHDFTRHDTLRSRLRYSSYAKYIVRLMHKNNVSDRIHFLGMLNAAQMAEQLRLANAFICPSSIENSPNSLGEAQLVGCPSIASYAGGIPDFIEYGKDGLLFRFEESEMLAYEVCKLFGNDELAALISSNGIITASKRHDGQNNANRMMEIYQEIITSK